MARESIWHECLRYSIYYAPRGSRRLVMLGESLAQRYLSSTDVLIGILGESGTGKSSLVKGMFPGLELTNDDEGVNVRPAPVVQMHREGGFRTRTFHVDVRFEMAFVGLGEIAEAVRAAVEDGRRVVCEHFDVLYPALGMNAQFLMAVGDQVIVARPDVFGPFPDELARAIQGTAVYRRMAHTAEDLTVQVLKEDLGYERPPRHSDVPRGFVIELDERPGGLDLDRLERRVKELIAADLPVSYVAEDRIRIGDKVHRCAGPRIHVSRTSEIERFRIVKELTYDPLAETYDLVGLVGEPWPGGFISRHPKDPDAPLARP